MVSLSTTGSSGLEFEEAAAGWDVPVTEVWRGLSGLLGPESEAISFRAKSLSGEARFELVLREYDSPWDLSDGAKSPAHVAEVTIESDQWQEYVVPLGSLRPLNDLTLTKGRARLIALRALEASPARIALDELRVRRSGAAARAN